MIEANLHTTIAIICTNNSKLTVHNRPLPIPHSPRKCTYLQVLNISLSAQMINEWSIFMTQ